MTQALMQDITVSVKVDFTVFANDTEAAAKYIEERLNYLFETSHMPTITHMEVEA